MRTFVILRRMLSIVSLLAVLLTLGGCFFFRSKPDEGAREWTSRLSLGMGTEEVLSRVGPPQRRGYNLFDKKKEYWTYVLASDQRGKKRTRAAESDGEGGPSGPEVRLVFEQGKLVGWDHVTRN